MVVAFPLTSVLSPVLVPVLEVSVPVPELEVSVLAPELEVSVLVLELEVSAPVVPVLALHQVQVFEIRTKCSMDSSLLRHKWGFRTYSCLDSYLDSSSCS